MLNEIYFLFSLTLLLTVIVCVREKFNIFYTSAYTF